MGIDISVVIPLFNKKECISRALDSVLAQTYLPKEILVINDGSTDGSEKVVESLNIPCLRIIGQENLGVSAARNRGALEAQCDWVAFLDGDDEWMPEFLESINILHDKYPEKQFLCTSYYLGNHLGEKRAITLNKLSFDDDFGIMDNYFLVASYSSPPICSSVVCVKKDVLVEEIGGFPLNVSSGEDLITWARLSAQSPPAYCKKPLAVFWQIKAHTYEDKPNRIPESNDPIGKALVDLKKDRSLFTLSIDKYISHWHKMRASVYLRLGMRMQAVSECFKCLYYYIGNKRLFIYMLLALMPDFMIRSVFKKFGQKAV